MLRAATYRCPGAFVDLSFVHTAHGRWKLTKVRNTTSIDTEIGWECALTNNSNWRCSTYSHHTSHSVSRTCKVKAKRICGRRRRSRRRAPAALGAAARLALGIGPWPRLLSQPPDPPPLPPPPPLPRPPPARRRAALPPATTPPSHGVAEREAQARTPTAAWRRHLVRV